MPGQMISWNLHSFKNFLKHTHTHTHTSIPGGSDGKESARNAEAWVQSLSWEDPLEKGMATHSSTLGWRIPWIEEPGRL